MIDKKSGVSYYRQMMDYIRSQIAAGVYKPGDKLPSEKELVAIFRVNRHTVRQAMGELADCGLVYTQRGKGIFVSGAKDSFVDYRVSQRTSFTRNITDNGMIPDIRVLRAEEAAAEERVARNLFLKTGTPVVMLETLRLINQEPFCVSTNYFPLQLVPGLINMVAGIKSLYGLLDQYYGLRPVRTYSAFQATFPGQEDADVLGIPGNHPVLVVESAMTAECGMAVQYSITRFRGDRGRINVCFD